jgi:AmpD protein
MISSESGWIELPGMAWKPSPNHNERPTGSAVDLLVIHNISLPPGRFGTGYACDLFLNQLDLSADPWFESVRDLKVSSHFLIERDGKVTQFVSCDKRAWHAGASLFGQRKDCNDFSIGIELEGTDTVAFTDAQYDQLEALTRTLRSVYPLNHVRGHSDIAPTRKTDPGPCFDWHRYAKAAGWQPEQLPAHMNDTDPTNQDNP